MGKVKTHYDNLQVTENASPEVIKGAYRYLSQKWHPDRNPGDVEKATRITQIINEAFAVLSDPQRRREHDAWIADQRAEQAGNERAKPDSGSEEPPQSAAATAPPSDEGLTRALWMALLVIAAALAIAMTVGLLSGGIVNWHGGLGTIAQQLIFGFALWMCVCWIVGAVAFRHLTPRAIRDTLPQNAGLYERLKAGPIALLAASCGLGVIIAIGYFGRHDTYRDQLTRTVKVPELAPTPSPVQPPPRQDESESPAEGQTFYRLVVVNQCTEPLRFAMAFQDAHGQTRVSGWASLQPQETGRIEKLLAAPGVFLYGESNSAQFTWNGDDHADALSALVSTENFGYDLAHIASLDPSGFYPVKFFAITLQKDGGQFNFQCH